MARPLRIEYPGASYHVMNRGNQRQKVFYSASHYELFLDKLGESCVKFNVTVRCYCLMPNHFHLYLKTADANLGRFMQTFLTSFCYSLNRLRVKSGHIFQGRFKSHVASQAILGDEHFVESVKRRYAMNLNLTDTREQKDLSRLRSSFDFDETLKIVSKLTKVGEQDILRRRSVHSIERKMLMYCAEKYCRSTTPLSDIAARMSVSQSGLARSKGRFEKELADNKKLRRFLSEIEKCLVNSGSVTP